MTHDTNILMYHYISRNNIDSEKETEEPDGYLEDIGCPQQKVYKSLHWRTNIQQLIVKFMFMYFVSHVFNNFGKKTRELLLDTPSVLNYLSHTSSFLN
jgi:hypothetical protein